MATRAKAVRAEVAAAIQAIRDYWVLGRSCLDEVPERGGYGEKVFADLARQMREADPPGKWSETKVRKACQFAREGEGYSRRHLDDLCKLLRDHDRAIGTAFIGLFVTVSWQEGREDLQRRCVEEGWSKHRLQAAIKKLLGPRRYGGRHRRVGPDVADALVQLDGMADSWERWLRFAAEKDGRRKSLLDRLPETVRKEAASVGRAMRRLRKAVSGKLERIRRRLRPQDG